MSNTKDKQVSVILETYDYEKFRPMKQNRGVINATGTKGRKLKSIHKLIESGKFVPELATIKVNESLEVIDGHHRLLAMKQHKLPVRYEIIHDDRFNIATGREKLSHVYDVNAINPSWSQQDMYRAALAAKAPLAHAIEEVIKKHRNTFEFNSVLALAMKDEKVFTGARKSDVSMHTFDDKSLVEEMHSNEFKQELRYFNQLNMKFRITERPGVGFKAFYAILWRFLETGEDQTPVQFRAAYRQAVLNISENMLRNSERTRTFATWVRMLIETYNKKTKNAVRVATVIKALGKSAEE